MSGVSSVSGNPLIDHHQLGRDGTPGFMPKMPQSWWFESKQFVFRPTDGRVYDAYYNSPVFDLKPEFRKADPQVWAGVPINRAPALGGGPVLRAAITGNPAARGDTKFYLFVVGGVYSSQPLYRMVEEVDITTQIMSGGLTAVTGPAQLVGASPFTTEPPAGIRFWQVWIRATQTVQLSGATPNVYGIDAALW